MSQIHDHEERLRRMEMLSPEHLNATTEVTSLQNHNVPVVIYYYQKSFIQLQFFTKHKKMSNTT